jgi:hypothetical protein
MDPLPMAPSCALDEAGLRLQLGRYRQVGAGARQVERTRRSLVVDLDEQVDTQFVDETITLERECCPFFTLTWEHERRRLTIAVSHVEHEPALDAIAFALEAQDARSTPSVGLTPMLTASGAAAVTYMDHRARRYRCSTRSTRAGRLDRID